jgi:hypothetical protein
MSEKLGDDKGSIKHWGQVEVQQRGKEGLAEAKVGSF